METGLVQSNGLVTEASDDPAVVGTYFTAECRAGEGGTVMKTFRVTDLHLA